MRPHAAALACYLAIPLTFIGAAVIHANIDPEMARRTADYVGNYRLIERVATGVLLAGAVLSVLLWLATCHFVLRSRARSEAWLVLAVAGPFGFVALTWLADRSPLPHHAYARFVGGLRPIMRIALEAALFASSWVLAIAFVAGKREALLRIESAMTGVPLDKLVELQEASGGMMAFAEGLQMLYLVPLIYLLVPLLFNRIAGRRWNN